jgi:hypothetical protein
LLYRPSAVDPFGHSDTQGDICAVTVTAGSHQNDGNSNCEQRSSL